MGYDAEVNNAATSPQAWHLSVSGTMTEQTIVSFTMAVGNEGSNVTTQAPPAYKSPQISKSPVQTSQVLLRRANSTSTQSAADESAPQSVEDSVDDVFEWVRIPKKRDFELVQVLKTASAEEPDRANVPLTVTKSDGSKAIMWAKMDTGADTNLINLSTVRAIFGNDKAAEDAMYPLRKDEEYNLVGANHIDLTHRINLSFEAGRSTKKFEDISFVVYPDEDPADSSTDYVPNVILGLETVLANRMLVVDYEYHGLERKEGVEVISKKAESEGIPVGAARGSIGAIVKAPRAQGVTRR